MIKKLHDDALSIVNYSIQEVLPQKAVKKALENYKKPVGKTIMIAIGKAAYSMALETVSDIEIDEGLVVTKYNHAKGPLNNTEIIEAGHPLLDENSVKAANKAISLCSNLTKDDLVIFLVSGGGSALFEAPLITLDELQDVNSKLLKCGANINEINTIRKRLSSVKGGKLGRIASPAKIMNIILSDIINDPLDMIASGPTYPDASSSNDALNIVNKYHLNFSDKIMNLLKEEPVKELNNIENYITGNNELLKLAAKKKCEELGYEVAYVEKPITSDVIEARDYLQNEINAHINEHNVAIIMGGEITVNVKGNGLGGRNQELPLHLAKFVKDSNVAVFAVGSDGTDGPTDAAGGYVDTDTFNEELESYLNNNDAYNFYKKYGGLITTGPTGTNVCDLYCALIK